MNLWTKMITHNVHTRIGRIKSKNKCKTANEKSKNTTDFRINMSEADESKAALDENDQPEHVPADMQLEDITDGRNERGIPAARFIEDISSFSNSFQPVPASAELLIGAFTQLHTKYKTSEQSLMQKKEHLNLKVPELEKSLTLVQSLLKKKNDGEECGSIRYNLADQIYAKAEIDYSGIVHLWLGANVMLEYTYEEAISFLDDKRQRAQTELSNTSEDLSYVRDQIVTCEVNMSRIYNWDVRRKRAETAEKAAASAAACKN